jgi:lipoprotein signal peptidase
MHKFRHKFLTTMIIFCLIAIDQWTKAYTLKMDQSWQLFSFLSINPQTNAGLIAGLYEQHASLIRLLSVGVLGYLYFLLLVVQEFVPLHRTALRFLLPLLVSSWMANGLDKIVRGYTVDFIEVAFPGSYIVVLNLADIWQYIALFGVVAVALKHGSILVPPEERRNNLIVDWAFQSQIAGVFLGAGALLSFTLVGLNYCFLSLTNQWQSIFGVFWTSNLTVTLVFNLTIFLYGLSLTKKIVGPVQKFVKYIDATSRGEITDRFSLRDQDFFQGLMLSAQDFRSAVAEKMGLLYPKIEIDENLVPLLKTRQSSKTEELLVLMQKPCWIVFYRYIGCPICLFHAQTTLELFKLAADKGVNIVWVFESGAIANPMENERFRELIAQIKGVILMDPERILYRLFSTSADWTALLNLQSVVALAQSLLAGFRQGKIAGTISQVPAHFLTRPGGVVVARYYGHHLGSHVSKDTISKYLKTLEGHN